MSEMTTTPPAPPEPPAPSQSPYLDFGKPFTFVFEDPDWLKKILIGGLFYLASFILIGLFFLLGYCAKLARNVAAGVARPLPEWDNLGDYFVEGLKLAVIAIIYAIPFVLIFMIPLIGAGIAESVGGSDDFAAAIFGGFGCLMVPVILILVFWIPVALLFAAVSGRFEEGFNFSAIFGFIKNNFVNYLLAILINLVGNFISQFGVILLCIGVLFTAFWSMLVSTYAFADAYRLRRK